MVPVGSRETARSIVAKRLLVIQMQTKAAADARRHRRNRLTEWAAILVLLGTLALLGWGIYTLSRYNHYFDKATTGFTRAHLHH